MLRTILVPLDGSAFAAHALAVARSVAARSGAKIILTHVHVPFVAQPLDPWLLGGVPMLDEPDDAEQHARALEYLTAQRAELARAGVEASCKVLCGAVVPTLVEYAQSSAVDLVVMATHGRGVFSRVWLGSVADAVVRHSPIPTLLVRPHRGATARPDAERPTEVRRALIPLDGSALAEQILEPATAMCKALQANVTLLRVVETLPVLDYLSDELADRADDSMQPQLDDAQTYLDDVARRLRERGLTVTTLVQIAAHAAPAILDLAREDGYDLIALATHGRGGLTRLLIGSVADKLVRSAEVPVLLLRPRHHGGKAQPAENTALHRYA